jgi:hypothetical protein
VTFSAKHIGLLIGIVLIFISFLFFGRQEETYMVLSLLGFVIASISYLIIVFGSGYLKAKLFWTGFVICCAIIQQLTEPLLIDISYRIYISQNKNLLTEVNSILMQKQSDITILNNDVTKDTQLTVNEIDKLRDARKKLGTYLIEKTDKEVYYGLWGFLDVRLGIVYRIDTTKSDKPYRHLTGNWFY